MQTSVRTLFDDVDHPEDICTTSSGALVFGGERGQVYLGDPVQGTFRKIGSTGGRSLGIAVDGDDGIYVCDPRRRAVVALDADGTGATVLSDGAADRPLFHPNSISFDLTGIAWVSDSGHWGADDGSIFAIHPDGTTILASSDFKRFTNGVAVSPDGRYLYVIESRFGVARAPIEGASLGPREEVIALGDTVPDGLAFCDDGGLLVSCFQPNLLLHLDAGGNLETLLDDPTGIKLAMPTNVAFFGPGNSSLAIANLGARNVVVVEVGLVGAPLHRPRVERLKAKAA